MDKIGLLKKGILKHLYFNKQLSSADLSEKLSKSLPVVLKLLNELIRDGEVMELGYAPSTGGRRPMLYTLQKNVRYVLTVAMDQVFTKIGLMNMEHEFVKPVRRYDLRLADNPEALSGLEALIQDYIKINHIDGATIAGIGIGMPGFVDVEKGINYSFIPSGEHSIAEFLEERLNLPVYIDNDSSLVALSEYRFGAARKRKNVMVVNMSWGVGLGIIIKGELFRGNNGFAGEFSHIPIFTSNKLCSCGKTGCLETEASLLVLIEKAKEGIRNGKTTNLRHLSDTNPEEAYESIVSMALKGDKFCIEIISEIGYNIGRGLAILIHILNPELIILSGRGASAGKLWRAPIQQAINEHSIPRLAEHTEIEISTVGARDELLGAAALVMENFGKDRRKKKSKGTGIELI
ncbi:ROK family protein [Flavihumibacter petaseus]|uniref:Putative NagC family transcriptional regulator n=1 Tax=Flavihumibacter petaseus NBRC 106054 TaxID=1220578 RepID=A0A0E9MTS1_9BACT|nr:ROK family protein [Flavihumibacter petaseus]GAO41172.1 putative NagC family transcriptional regulator [Flavihumibacter petaseus NBRC 106054]